MTRRHRLEMRVFHTLAVVVLSLVMLVAGAHLFGAAFERPYLRYTNLPFPVLAPAFAGESVQLQVNRCNDDQVSHGYLVTHQLENLDTGLLVLLPDVMLVAPPGCTQALSRLNLIPPDTAPGRYRVSGRAEIHGLLGQHVVEWQSVPFEVLPERKQP